MTTHKPWSDEPAFPIPGAAVAREASDALAASISQAYLRPAEPGRRRADRHVQASTPDPDDALVPWERALDLIKNVMVIVTCAAVLYSLWRAYVAIDALGDALSQLVGSFGGQ